MNCWVEMNLALPYVAKALQTNKLLSFCVSPRVSFPLDIRRYSSSDSFREYDIGSDSIKSLSEMLMVNKALTILELASDKLTKDDVFTLSDALQHNSSYSCFSVFNRGSYKLTNTLSLVIGKQLHIWINKMNFMALRLCH